jgi:hypothetical protein
MHPDLNIEIAIQRQMGQIEKKYKKQIRALQKADMDKVKLGQVVSQLAYDDRKRNMTKQYEDILGFYFILSKDFSFAWFLKYYMYWGWTMRVDRRINQIILWKKNDRRIGSEHRSSLFRNS